MTLRLKRMGRSILAIAALLAASTTVWSQETPQERQPAPIVLAPSGLSAEETPEAVLPAGALVHLRINGAGPLLDDTSAMAKPFVPERALPPPLREALEQPNALLAIVGMMTVGQPMSVEQLSAMSGIEPKRPVSLSIYPGAPNEAFVLAVPVHDLAAFSGLLSNMLPHREVEKIELEGGSVQHIQVPDVNLFVACSENSVFVCGSHALAQQLFAAPREARLDRAPLMARALKQTAAANVSLVIDAGPLKPMLPMLEQYGHIPEDNLVALRRDMVGGFNEEELQFLNDQLRTRLGVRDVGEAFDYAECLITAGYEVIFEYLLAEAANFDGLAVSIDISSGFQRVEFSAYSKSITADGARRPAPLAEMAKVVGKTPGAHNALVFSGQARPAAKSKLLGSLLERLGAKMREKELPPTLHQALWMAYDQYQPQQSLESKVAWTLTTKSFLSGAKPPQEYASLLEFLDAAQNDPAYSMPYATLQAIPRQEKNFLAKHYSDQMEARNVNDRVYRRLLGDLGFGQPFYVKDSRSKTEDLNDGVTKLIQENSYTTRWGLFGYNEHELINRHFILARDMEGFTLLYPGGRDPAIMVDFKPQPVPAAIRRLLAKADVPKDANYVEVLRVLQGVSDLVDFLAGLEDLIHRDLAGYLAKVEAIRDDAAEGENIMTKIAALPMPPEVLQLKITPDRQRRLYLTTPVQLTYPRPKVMPEVRAVLKNYLDAADSLGGAAVYQRTTDGQYDLVLVQSTEALAALVRTTGNSIFDRYLSGPEGSERLQRMGLNRFDREHQGHPTVLLNSTWEMFGP